ncbi:MAG: SoxY-related arm protein [Noviherbaspirillum sp.]|jgi:sulfur-oxidizing protein SoxY|nr:SoxY-related arm protein [Noviherbaspirillum sp.]
MTSASSPPSSVDSTRRKLLAAGASLGAVVMVRPVFAAPDELAAAIDAYTGGAKVNSGRVDFDIAKLVDNGNTVPVTVTVDSPMLAANHVSAIAIFNERNPQRDVARFTLGPRAGKASVSTRIRLATSQKLVAIAKLSDGTYWSQTVNVVVTLASCIEGES